MKSIFFIFSILLLKLRVTISFGFFENHIPKVLNGPILILIFDKESGTTMCLELLLPMGIISVLSRLICNPEYFLSIQIP